MTPGSESLVFYDSLALTVRIALLIGLSVYLTGILSHESSLRSSTGCGAALFFGSVSVLG